MPHKAWDQCHGHYYLLKKLKETGMVVELFCFLHQNSKLWNSRVCDPKNAKAMSCFELNLLPQPVIIIVHDEVGLDKWL